MKKSLWQMCLSSVFSVLVIPALTLGATAAALPGAAEPAPLEQMDSQQVARLLDRMQIDVARVHNAAVRLHSFYLSGVTWQQDASTIDRIAYRVRKMDDMLSTLRAMQREVSPAQAQTIARLAPQVIVLTNELNISIHYLNNNHHYLWSPTWRMDTADVDQTSHILEGDLRGIRQEPMASLPATRTAKVAS